MIEAVAGGARVGVHVPLAEVAGHLRDQFVDERVPTSLSERRLSMWPQAVAADIVRRTTWLDLAASSADLASVVHELAAERAELDHVVLLGMGGSSLAAEVVAVAAEQPLRVLDTTDPHQVRAALAEDPARLLVVLASKSGETVESESLGRVFVDHLHRHLGKAATARHIVVITDPGSRLHATAMREGYACVLSDPMVGGRFSALGPFGLVAPGLLGADIAAVVRAAAAVRPSLANDADNPGLLLGAALAAAAERGRDKVLLCAEGAAVRALPNWIEQLVSESTGKDGRGILPVIGSARTAAPADAVRVVLGVDPRGTADIVVDAPLGAQFLLWEYATTVASYRLGVNPFDQPNVEESKANTQAVLAGDHRDGGDVPLIVTDAVEVHLNPGQAAGPALCERLEEVFEWLLTISEPAGYLAVMAFLDRSGDQRVAEVAQRLRERTSLPVTFGWGPRFLHSTGQLHKGGPPTGAFLQITAAAQDDVRVPGRPFGLARLQAAQAEGDRLALARRGRPVVRMHLRDRRAGLDELTAAARHLS
ncbi:glucose-6-phosphate isomerase [Micromonospora sp. WMMA1976]|uniref:glucose-6-phosphate isomerase n=1 Tax=Micromonospora sp. WMMA1976 TaxID=3014995 RepID=UPI00248BCF61|nr:glucose-6-phosphate isomerase [Micromonospora sp. WMMA1976]WBC03677.1 glucose-6-phosphate isomerase [Micromonospora sp. WMMA1976]